jgi:hypothetical protein
MPALYLVEISIIDDDPDSTPERVKEDLTNLLAGTMTWGHIDVKKAKIAVVRD